MLSEALLGEKSAATSKNFLLFASCFAFHVGRTPNLFWVQRKKKVDPYPTGI